jgi:hypothetical protein
VSSCPPETPWYEPGIFTDDLWSEEEPPGRFPESLHDHVWGARIERSHVENSSDVLALDAHCRPRFSHESRDDIWIRESILLQEFDRDRLFELNVSGGHDDAHSANADDALDAVASREHRA